LWEKKFPEIFWQFFPFFKIPPLLWSDAAAPGLKPFHLPRVPEHVLELICENYAHRNFRSVFLGELARQTKTRGDPILCQDPDDILQFSNQVTT